MALVTLVGGHLGTGTWDRVELVYASTHGRWLNMAESEINVMASQRLSRHIDTIAS